MHGPAIAPRYLSKEFVGSFARSFQEQCQHGPDRPDDQPRVLHKVFPLGVFPGFLKETFARRLRDLLMSGNTIPFRQRKNDLYDFWQTGDLKQYAEKEDLVDVLCNDLFSASFIAGIEQIVGRKLGNTVDISAQKYENGNYLLCHDDRLEGRRVAFVLYLVDGNWTGGRDGGELEMFYTDWAGKAMVKVSEAFVPQWNTLVFFEVSMWSHHQVCEILGTLPRLSVSGWFHDADDCTEQLDCDDRLFLEPTLPGATALEIKPMLKHEIQQSLQSVRWSQVFTCAGNFFVPEYDREPAWIKAFLHPRCRRALMSLLNLRLDWPTRPVAKIAESGHELEMDLDDSERIRFVLFVGERNSPIWFEGQVEVCWGVLYAVAKRSRLRIKVEAGLGMAAMVEMSFECPS